jgi:HlyD family secretion protein
VVDIPRAIDTRKRLRRRVLYGAGALLGVALITLGLSRLEPAAPGVERATVWIDTVKRGPMIRQVRGAGTLVPEEIRWIPAVSTGRVERILALPGTVVEPDTILLELVNPELELTRLEAESQLKAAEAELINLRVQLQSQLFTQQATEASVEAESKQARLQAEADAELARNGLVPDLTLKLSTIRADELAQRAGLEKRRVEITAQAAEAQIAVQQAQVDRARALSNLRRSQLEGLRVRAGAAGVLQQVPVEVGQQVAPGTNLARVAEPKRLKAEVRIGETQARDVQVGQVASIDTRNGVVAGRVTRIDPAVQNGTVTVDVALEGELPRGARPDLSVDGTIELERLASVLYVGRPAFGQEQSSVGLFRLGAGGRDASRTQVKLGRSSVNTVEILEGLNEGDQVILSDMSAWDAYDRVRLN